MTTFEPVALEVSALSCRRGDLVLFEDLSFSLDAGDALEIAGPNGAGKSSLLRALAGVLRAENGDIRFLRACDRGICDDPGLLRHFVGHDDGLKASLTLAETLSFWQGALGVSPDRRARMAEQALADFDLAPLADMPLGYLSAGQRRRASLSRLLACPRPVWLLDEPTVALDQANRQGFAQIMQAHRQAGGIVIAATHMPLGLIDAYSMALEGMEELPC